jgi:3-hydroxybutyryl-CoA dehydratase
VRGYRKKEITGMMFKKGDQFKLEFAVTQSVHSSFIQTFGDRNPLHTDEEFAKSKGFKGRVMHGNILGGFLSFFIGESLPLKNVIIHSQEIKYFNPVYMDDTVLFTAEVNDVYESVNTIEFKFIFENREKTRLAKGKIQIGII